MKKMQQTINELCLGMSSAQVLARFDIPFPPSTNSIWRSSGRGGRHFLSKKYLDFKNEVKKIVTIRKIQLKKYDKFMFSGRFYLFIILFPSDNIRRDADNYVKSVQDSFTSAGVWEDDSQIDQTLAAFGMTVAKHDKGAVVFVCRSNGKVNPVYFDKKIKNGKCNHK